MQDTDYAYAVASIRVREKTLVSDRDLSQFSDDDTYETIIQFLREHAWDVSEDDVSTDDILRHELMRTWALLCDVAPDPSLFHALVIRKDYHNLKAAIKSLLSGDVEDRFFLTPNIISHEQILDAVRARDFSQLPAPMAEAGKKAYEALVTTEDGQLSDIIIDTCALKHMWALAQASQIMLLIELTELFVAAAEIKSIFRAMLSKKDADFMARCLFSFAYLDDEKLVAAAQAGEAALLDFLLTTRYAEACAHLPNDLSAFEKWFDDRIIECVRRAKFMFLGPDPLIAFYIAKEAEIKNLRLLLSAKQNHIDPARMSNRMRRLYAP